MEAQGPDSGSSHSLAAVQERVEVLEEVGDSHDRRITGLERREQQRWQGPPARLRGATDALTWMGSAGAAPALLMPAGETAAVATAQPAALQSARAQQQPGRQQPQQQGPATAASPSQQQQQAAASPMTIGGGYFHSPHAARQCVCSALLASLHRPLPCALHPAPGCELRTLLYLALLLLLLLLLLLPPPVFHSEHAPLLPCPLPQLFNPAQRALAGQLHQAGAP